MGVIIHLDAVGSSNPQGSGYLGSFTNWTALNVAYPSASVGDFAVTEDSEGTAWLPWTLGGTYYPQGTYYYDGSIWSSNVELISEELQEINNQLALVSPLITVSKSANYNAVANDYILMTTGATDKTVTLPLSPSKDDKISVIKYDDSSGLVVVDGNGKKIYGETTISISNQWTSLPFRYDGVKWIIE